MCAFHVEMLPDARGGHPTELINTNEKKGKNKMKLVWERIDNRARCGTCQVEYRAWGVAWPMRILESPDWVVLEALGSGCPPARIRVVEGSGCATVKQIAQRWEDADQQLHDTIVDTGQRLGGRR